MRILSCPDWRTCSWTSVLFMVSRYLCHFYDWPSKIEKIITALTSLFIPCSSKLKTFTSPMYISNPGSNFNNKAKKPLLLAPFTSKLNSITKSVSCNIEISLVSEGCIKSKVCPVGIKPTCNITHQLSIKSWWKLFYNHFYLILISRIFLKRWSVNRKVFGFFWIIIKSFPLVYFPISNIQFKITKRKGKGRFCIKQTCCYKYVLAEEKKHYQLLTRSILNVERRSWEQS